MLLPGLGWRRMGWSPGFYCCHSCRQTDLLLLACEALLSSTVGRSGPLLLGRYGWGMGCPPKSASESTAVTTYESSHLVSAGLSLSWLS